MTYCINRPHSHFCDSTKKLVIYFLLDIRYRGLLKLTIENNARDKKFRQKRFLFVSFWQMSNIDIFKVLIFLLRKLFFITYDIV